MTYVVTQPCCNDATCVAVCPVNCIHPTPDEPDYPTTEMLYIDPAGCIDCGACVDACPVDAVVPDFDLTEHTERYLDINARYFADPRHQGYSTQPYVPAAVPVQVTQREPLRVAIVGSGPAACYAAEELLTRKDIDAQVHMFERLPTPWGLVRFGVAPDHAGTKAVTKLFTRTAGQPGLEFHLNVDIGTHLRHEELLAHHHAVVYAVGASTDRRLGVRGEELPGSHSATDFVAWYNGHPDSADRSFDLSAERVVIVGNGNVALDVARILASDVGRLARTDIADHALDALAASRITEVVVLGRRGPAQAAFTTPELLGLIDTPGFDVTVRPAEAHPDALTAAVLAADSHGVAALKAQLVRELAQRPSGDSAKRVVLRFLTSPVEVLGDDRVRGLRSTRNELVAARDGVQARPTGETEDLDCGLVLRSIGYRGRPLPGLPFDEVTGTLPNDSGRVLPGVYAAGWIKRGPSGVIGTNKKCAAETVSTLLDDYAHGRLAEPRHDAENLRALLARRRPEAIGYAGWKAIDRHERLIALGHQRPRIKVIAIEDMLRIAAGEVPVR